MKKTILAVLAMGALSCALFSQQAQAVPITGNITFSGGVQFEPGNVNTATEAESWHSVVVNGADGSFTGLTGSSATFQGEWTFVLAQPALWTVGGFTFDLNAGSIVLQGGGFINISGTGTISGNGFTPTAGNFTFSSQNPGSHGQFSFSASGTTSVPDGGSAVALLGIALTGIEVLRRRLRIG
jgi:hypothetical protein